MTFYKLDDMMIDIDAFDVATQQQVVVVSGAEIKKELGCPRISFQYT